MAGTSSGPVDDLALRARWARRDFVGRAGSTFLLPDRDAITSAIDPEVLLHPEARAELCSAALWHDERRTGLCDEFIAEVSATLDRTDNAPESYPASSGTRAGPLIRKATVQRFP
jgi:hypothetical protein